MKRLGVFIRSYGLSAMVVLIYLLLNGRLLNGDNLALLLRQTAIQGVLALGTLALVVPGGYFISAGSHMLFAGFLLGWLYSRLALPLPLCVGLCLALALPFALLHNFFVSRLGVPLLVFSFAVIPVLEGLSATLAHRASLPSVWLLHGGLFGVYPVVLLFVGVAVLLWFFYRSTTWGCAAIAMGENPLAAEASGLRTGWAMLVSFTLGFVLIQASGMLSVLWPQYISGNYAFTNRNYDVVCILCFAGVPLQGGRARITAVALGTLAVVLLNSLFDMNSPPLLNSGMVKGAVIVLALFLQLPRRKFSMLHKIER